MNGKTKLYIALALIGAGVYMVAKKKDEVAEGGVVIGTSFLPFNVGWLGIAGGAFLLLK